MGANRTIVLLLAAWLAVPTPAQTTGKTVLHHRVAVEESAVSPLVTEAESALDHHDYPTAEQKLNEAVAQNPKDFRAWYDLGFVLNATDRKPEAVAAYRKSVAVNPQVFESNLNLGLLLAASGGADAETFLRAATQLKPTAKPEEGLARAWLSLGHVLEKSKPAEAVSAFQKAAELQPREVEPHLSAAAVLERQGDAAAAEKEFQRAVELDPKSSEALASLANLYARQHRLAEGEAALRRYLALDRQNAAAHVQLGRVLAAQGRADDASTEYEAALKIDPNDRDANREVATALLEATKYDEAAARFQVLVQADPRDPQLRYGWGTALLKARRFPEAQAQLLETVKLKPDLGDAYSDLALAASENKQYPLAIQALDARAKYLPETPGTYFLRATSYDNLKAHKQAAANYRLFLANANGKFPDQEWQARHRLIAIDPGKK